MKKMIKGIVTGLAMFAIIGTANAADYTVNMCGASAQAGFWQQAGAAVVQDALNCSDAVLDGIDDKHMVVRGQNCNADGGATNDDTVYVRYNVVNSSFGCTNYDCTSSEGWANPSSCDFDGSGFTCDTAQAAQCMLGCADVACEEITATTIGFPSGRKGAPVNGGTEAMAPQGNAAGYPTTADTFYNGVVVPFGFIVNNAVTDAVCTYGGLDENAHLAYDKRGWECDPEEVEACVGAYKCIDPDGDGTGVCQDGNQGTANETTCSDSRDCIADDVTLGCEAQPMKNISRLMALHIFSDQVQNWNAFGPSFPSLPIVKCMRHGGSGTHQTLIDTVFRGDALLATVTRFIAPAGNFIWHYTSSSDLTRDCVAYYDGGIGYVDADKALETGKLIKGIHQLMYQGVAPSRLAVANGKYNFWSAQSCFLDSTAGCYGTEGLNILNLIMTKAGDPTFLTYAGFGQKAYFWATQDEMSVSKTNGYAYPKR